MLRHATKLYFSPRAHGAPLLLGLCLGLSILGYPTAQGQEVFTSQESAQLYGSITTYEQELYGRTYPQDGTKTRMERLEKTLFGTRQPGNAEQRLLRINQHMDARQQASAQNEQQPILDYLEEKLFQRTFGTLPREERLTRLESKVFGKPFGDYPVEIRMKKLTYAMPLTAREIRVSNEQGQVVASTGRKPLTYAAMNVPTPPTATTEPPNEVTLLDASADTPPPISPPRPLPTHAFTPPETARPQVSLPVKPLPITKAPLQKAPLPMAAPQTIAASTRPTEAAPQVVASSVSTGDYTLSIHRRADGRVVRWSELPMKVYIRGTAEEKAATLAAIELWKHSFPITLSDNPLSADVLVDWANSNRPIGPFTQPITNLDHQRRVRTVVLINMTPFQALSPTQQHHALLHQLGHAAGLWGHSSNPNDVMYPALELEHNDIPRLLSNRTLPTTPARSTALSPDIAPSQRDINTLLKLYNMPEQDLKTYTPY